MIVDYFATIDSLLPTLDSGNVELAAEIAGSRNTSAATATSRKRTCTIAKTREAELLAQWRNPLRVVQVA